MVLKSFISNFKKRFFVILIFLGTSAYAQDQNTQDAYIQKKLNHIDSLLLEKEYEKAETVIKNTKNTFSFRNDIESKLALQYREAQILYNQGKQEDAVELFLIGLEKLRGHPTSYLNIEYASFLAKVFAGSQNFDKAIYYNKIALRKSLYLADTVNITKSYIRLGSFYYAKRKIDSAEYFFRRVTYFPVTPDTEQRISNAYNNLGVIAQNDDNFDLAKAWSKKALRIKQKQKDSLGMALLTVNIGNLDHYQFRYDRAINSYSEALRTIAGDSTKQAMHFKKGIYENLAVSYDSLGDYKMAFKNLSESVKIEEILTVDNLAENIAEVEAKYNLALEEQKTEEEKGKVFRAQVLFFGLAFLTLMFVVFSFIFYKNYKLKEQNKLEQINNDLQTRIINATIDAKEKERKSIAEILHDSVSALLSSANLHLQASKAQLKTEIPAEISKAQEIVNEASVKIRDLSHELISSVLLKFGLAFAVHDICEKYSNSELELVSDDNGIKRYNQKFEIKIYNIIEELINNILKHSKAKNASITLIERNDEKLLIQIIDDGQGFDVTKERKKDGLGLSHIEARVKIMEGVFNINSKKGEGTSIFISVPIYKLKIAQTA